MPCVEEPQLILLLIVTGLSCLLIGWLIAVVRIDPWNDLD